MISVTRKEPPAKKQRLAIEMPDGMTNRDKLPLHVMKGVFDYIPRQEQSKLRLVCSFWDSCISMRPSHFRPFLKFLSLSCELSNTRVYSIGNRWLDISRDMNCCEHLKDLASEMVGKLFLPQQETSAQIKLAMTTPSPTGYLYGNRWISHLFRNKLSRTTSFSVLHLLYHLREGAFDELYGRTISLLRDMHPDIAKLLLPMRCRRFWIDHRPESDVPSLESITAIAKPQEIAYQLTWNNTAQSSERVKGILETFAIGTRHIYKSIGFSISFWAPGGVVNNDHWTGLFKLVIEFLSERRKESRQMVPRVYFIFLWGSPIWPLSPFSAMKPTRVKEEQVQVQGTQLIKRTLRYKLGGEGGTKRFEAVVKCRESNGSNYFRCVSFLFK